MVILKQISLTAENKPGELEKITGILSNSKINILAINLSGCDKTSIIKLIVDNPETACKNFKENGYKAKLDDVFGFEMEDKPGSFHNVAGIFAKNNLNIENVYVYVKEARNNAALIIEVKDMKKAKSSF